MFSYIFFCLLFSWLSSSIIHLTTAVIELMKFLHSSPHLIVSPNHKKNENVNLVRAITNFKSSTWNFVWWEAKKYYLWVWQVPLRWLWSLDCLSLDDYQAFNLNNKIMACNWVNLVVVVKWYLSLLSANLMMRLFILFLRSWKYFNDIINFFKFIIKSYSFR